MMRAFEQNIKINIPEKECRGCKLCVDVCPVEVFSFDENKHIASVKKEDNCIGCLSCYYICPSACIDLSGVPHSKNFYFEPDNLKIITKIL